METKSSLAIRLSRLKSFIKPKLNEEQYQTPSEIAADLLWNTNMIDSFEGKVVADLGCGTGILGIGAIILGAKKAYFLDSDREALTILRYNLADFCFDYEIIHKNIKDFDADDLKEKADIILTNPPFGTKTRHADRTFLEKAFISGEIIYSFHKKSTIQFIKRFSEKKGRKTTHIWDYRFPIKASHSFHKKPKMHIDVVCCRFERIKET